MRITFAQNILFNMSLLIVGTMAFDALETPFAKVDRIIGGSATYAAWAASNLRSSTAKKNEKRSRGNLAPLL